jgi:hypothetical protein
MHLILGSPLPPDDPEENVYDLDASWSELERRGIDAEAVARTGFGEVVALSVAIFSATGEKIAEKTGQTFRHLEAWRELLSAGLKACEARGEKPRIMDQPALTHGYFGDMPDATWTPPTPQDFLAPLESVDSTPESGSPSVTVRWVLDRFLLTYTDQWAEESLMLEWRWLHGRLPAPCSPSTMKSRQTMADVVSRAIAEKMSVAPVDKEQVAIANTSQRADQKAVVLDEFVYVALEAIQAGKIGEAVAIYGALASVAPRSADVQNNYGFCLIPTDRELSSKVLERAAELAAEPDLTNVANRAVVAMLDGRPDEAIKLATTHFSPYPTFKRAYLWRLKAACEGKWEIHLVGPSEYMADVAALACGQLNDTEGVEEWRRRAAALRAS